MDETQNKIEEKIETPVEEVVTPAAPAPEAQARGNFRGRDSRGPRRDNNRRGPRREPRAKPEFDNKIVSLRRVVRVVSGGRRFSFSVALVAGNRKGQVGVGFGKATDTPLAIDKAMRDAKKNMITVNMTKGMSIPHEIEAKYAASVVKMMPAPGKGIVAGSSVRTVLELAGITNVGAKLYSRSKNHANNAFAAVKALQKLEHTKIRESK